MPYKLRGNCVMKLAGPGRWIVVKCHPSKEEAQAHLTALNMNVKEASGKQSGAMKK